MVAPERTLVGYVEKFLRERDVSRDYAEQIRKRCRHFVRWKRRSVRINELTHDDINAWLACLRERNLRPETIAGYRRNLLTIWRDAYNEGANDNPPLRVRQIKVPRRIIEAYTLAEINKLLVASSKLHGRHANGNRRADFWQAMIHAAYSTALRRGDLLLVFRHQIANNGVASIIQSKTGHQHTVRFSDEALYFANRLTCPNGLLLPWPYRKDALPPRFQALKRLAGVNRGTLKWIRRSSASYADREQPGNGTRILGHRSPQLFNQAYNDRSISGEKPPEPPKLK